jgi:hypothetical protein
MRGQLMTLQLILGSRESMLFFSALPNVHESLWRIRGCGPGRRIEFDEVDDELPITSRRHGV